MQLLAQTNGTWHFQFISVLVNLGLRLALYSAVGSVIV